MPSKKKKYNARFPAGRIKKIMQTDEEVGKVAQAVPVIISRTLELFVESLLKRAMEITSAKNAKTLTPCHMKQCILSENKFDFLKDLVKDVPDVYSMEQEAGSVVSSPLPSPMPSLSPAAFPGFQFKTTERRVSTSSLPKTPTTSKAGFNTPTSSAAQPKFYQEIPIGESEMEPVKEDPAPAPVPLRPPVIRHTANCDDKVLPSPPPLRTSPTVAAESSSEEEEAEEEVAPARNGFHAPLPLRPPLTTEIDEDYDT